MSMLGADQDFERQLKDDFLVEASELIADTEALFLQLEKDPKNSPIVDKIFRIVFLRLFSGSYAQKRWLYPKRLSTSCSQGSMC
jgi:hypothetical protein